MALPYQELYYASTQQSILTGADGFGVRTHTQGLPKELVERLKVRNVFLYNAGAKSLVGIFELMQDPALVETFPKSFAFFREEVQGKAYFVFTRTVFLGRDYGWYMEQRDESARSGNLFCHAIFLQEKDFISINPAVVFRELLQQFRPFDFKNVPGNKELKILLTNQQGPPVPLPTNHCTQCGQDLSPHLFDHIEESLVAAFSALETSRKVVVIQHSAKTESHLISFLSCLPRFVVRALSFVTNYHDFNLVTDNMVVFLNENYQREIPASHPYLIVCDHRNGKFPTLPASDLFDHLRSLIRSRNIAGLKNLIDGLDRMVAAFEPQVSFDQLFYAWLHLLQSDPYSYQFNPLEVIRKIKDYPLNTDFRNRLEQSIVKSFQSALDAEQHSKVAHSLDLLVDLNMSAERWKTVRSGFSDYFFKEDNATQLYQFCNDKALILDVLDLDEQKEGLINFVSYTTLPDEARYFFMQKFCEVLAPEDVESMLYMAALAGKLDSSFTRQLNREWGQDRYLLFLLQHDFFIFMGDQQPSYFEEDTNQYLQQLALKNEEPFSFLQSKITSAPFFHSYFNALAELADDERLSLTYNIQLLGCFAYLIEKELRGPESIQTLYLIIVPILRKFNWEEHHAMARTLTDNSQQLAALIIPWTKSREISAKKESEVKVCKDLLIYIPQVLFLREKIEQLTGLAIPDMMKKSAKEYPVRFMLAALPIAPWLEDKPTKMLFLNFYLHQEIAKLKFSWNNAALGLIEFIPIYYQYRMLRNDEVDRDQFIDFHCTYIQMLWSLRRQKKGDADNPETIPIYQIKEKVAIILKQLKELDKSACNAVMEFVFNEMDDRDTDLAEYIQEHVQSGVAVKKIFKKITSVFKKNKP